jgi:hypothetical protein
LINVTAEPLRLGPVVRTLGVELSAPQVMAVDPPGLRSGGARGIGIADRGGGLGALEVAVADGA